MSTNEKQKEDRRVCRWVNQADALKHFATYTGPIQSQDHIKPLHWYVACRLVLEGGFNPDDITPRPPFKVSKHRGEFLLSFDAKSAMGGEATILGGLKTKNVDVVISKTGIGPVLAVSCKGMMGALRNLTNRMEETIGECTNLHITYPALVIGYLFVIRGNLSFARTAIETAVEKMPAVRQLTANDIAIQVDGEPVESIVRFESALQEMTGRRGIRDDISRYEAVALAMVGMEEASIGSIMLGFPPMDSPLRLERFFKTLYTRYDERYVTSAPDLKRVTRRVEWSPRSPACEAAPGKPVLGYEIRLSGTEPSMSDQAVEE